ncbi:MAG: alpha/beta hydrolase [Aquiluna sp.]|nr:alpha/beta hydrolase [Aquiluna sp.]MCF8545809.1 alpha/beta hydrolase [Aquiluna sp.]
MKKILFLHGWTNKRPVGHWARLTAAALRSRGHQVWYPQFPSPDSPNPIEWQDLLRQEANMMDEVEGGEKVAIAHSLGTINWLLGAKTNLFDKPFDRVLLAAIPDPIMTTQAEGIEGEALDFSDSSLLAQSRKWARNISAVASDQDRWQPNGIDFYKNLELETTIVPGAGHFSLDDGWGKWSGLETWVESANPQDLRLR